MPTNNGQFLQVNSSQLKIDIRVTLCTNLSIVSYMAAILGESQIFRFEFCQFMNWSHPADLFWVTRTLNFFEIGHYGLRVLIIVQITYCSLPIFEVESQTVTNISCLVCVKREKYASLVYFRPLGSMKQGEVQLCKLGF